MYVPVPPPPLSAVWSHVELDSCLMLLLDIRKVFHCTKTCYSTLLIPNGKDVHESYHGRKVWA